MPRRMSREERVRAAIVAVARRNLSGREPGPVPVPRSGRPKVVLRVEKPQRDAETSEPGTVTTNGVMRLYVGRDWFPAAGTLAPFAASLLGAGVLEIVGITKVAGERARRRLNRAWRLSEVIASGRLDEATTDRLRAALARM